MKRGNRAALGVMFLGVGYLIYLLGTAAAPDALTCSLANLVRHGSCNPATGTGFIVATVVAVFIGAVLVLTALSTDSRMPDSSSPAGQDDQAPPLEAE